MNRFLAGDTKRSIDVFIPDVQSVYGAGLSGLVFNSAGLFCYYRKLPAGSITQLALASQTTTGAHTAGGFCEVDRTNALGLYRLDLDDTMISGEGYLSIYLRASGAPPTPVRVTIDKRLTEVDIISISGTRIHYNQLVINDIYYANIKYIKDNLTSQDEYTVQWFKNSTPLVSGQITNPAITIHNTDNNSSLISNKILNYFSVNHGGLRYNETSSVVTSGEPYLAVTSGIIDGSVRTWTNLIGLDYI